MLLKNTALYNSLFLLQCSSVPLYLLFNAQACKYSLVCLGCSRDSLASSLPWGFQHGVCRARPGTVLGLLSQPNNSGIFGPPFLHLENSTGSFQSFCGDELTWSDTGFAPEHRRCCKSTSAPPELLSWAHLWVRASSCSPSIWNWGWRSQASTLQH